MTTSDATAKSVIECKKKVESRASHHVSCNIKESQMFRGYNNERCFEICRIQTKPVLENMPASNELVEGMVCFLSRAVARLLS